MTAHPAVMDTARISSSPLAVPAPRPRGCASSTPPLRWVMGSATKHSLTSAKSYPCSLRPRSLLSNAIQASAHPRNIGPRTSRSPSSRAGKAGVAQTWPPPSAGPRNAVANTTGSSWSQTWSGAGGRPLIRASPRSGSIPVSVCSEEPTSTARVINSPSASWSTSTLRRRRNNTTSGAYPEFRISPTGD